MNFSAYNIVPQVQHAPPPRGIAPQLAGIRHVLLVGRLYQPLLAAAAIQHQTNATAYNNVWRDALADGAVLHLANIASTYDGGIPQWSAPVQGLSHLPRRVVAMHHSLQCTDVLNPANLQLAQSLAADVYRVCWFATRNGLFNTAVPCTVHAGLPMNE